MSKPKFETTYKGEKVLVNFDVDKMERSDIDLIEDDDDKKLFEEAFDKRNSESKVKK